MSRVVPFAIGIIAHAWWMRLALAWAMVLSSIVRAALVGATSLASTGVCVLLYVLCVVCVVLLLRVWWWCRGVVVVFHVKHCVLYVGYVKGHECLAHGLVCMGCVCCVWWCFA